MSDDADEALAVVVLVAIGIAVLPYILAAVLAVAVVAGLLWGLWRVIRWAWDAWNGTPEIHHVEDQRDAAVRDLIALRQDAVREMIDVARQDVIEGTAREVERR